jgi:putative PIN family toxin of toxin-antitoxin system
MTEPTGWVFDTNVLVSRLLLTTGPAAKAVDHALSQHGVLLFSNATLEELTEVLSRPKFDPYVTREDRRRFVELLGGVSRVLPITRHVNACRDPKDNKFLDIALTAPAQALITGDRDLLELNPFCGLAIMTPADYLRSFKP